MNQQEQEDFNAYRERINKQIAGLLTETMRLRAELKTAREDSMELSERYRHMKMLSLAASKEHRSEYT